MQNQKIEEFLEDMRMEGKAEGTLREYKRRLERVQKLGIDLEKCTKTEFLSSFLDTKLVKLSKTSTIRCILSTLKPPKLFGDTEQSWKSTIAHFSAYPNEHFKVMQQILPKKQESPSTVTFLDTLLRGYWQKKGFH